MRCIALTVGATLAAATLIFAPSTVVAAGENTASPQESYAIGYDIGRHALEQVRADGVEIDRESLAEGFRHAMLDADAQLSEEQIEDALAAVERRVASRLAEDRLRTDPVFRAVAQRNESRGNEFRARFAKEDGVKQLENGVLVRSLTSGDGEPVGENSVVRIKLRAELLDESVIADDDAHELRVSSALAGGRDALLQMREGDRWIIVIPPARAFGLAGRQPDVGPNETIVADVEVLGIIR